MTWTRDKIIEKIRRWEALYGEPPRSADLNPSAARWSNAAWRIDRYKLGDPETGEAWPSLNAVKAAFDGSLNAALLAAGFELNRPGPPSRRSLDALTVPDREVMSPRARVALSAAEARARAAEERVGVLEGQLERARVARAHLVDNLDAARRAHKAASERAAGVPRPPRASKTTVRRVRVTDNAAVNRALRRAERAEARLADSDALARAEKDRGTAALRDVRKLTARAETLAMGLTEARAELKAAVRERKAIEDELTAARAAAERPRVVIEERIVRSASDREVAEARDAVHRAERAANEAEVRAARAEREMRELGALVTGEERRLSAAELVDLRRGGPSGPAVLARALSELAAARRRDNGRLPVALVKVASAAIRWRDAL